MPNNIAVVEHAYNAIYDYLMNKCSDSAFYKACLKEDIKTLKKCSIYNEWNDLYDAMIELGETIKQNNAKESGSGAMRKAFLSVIKNAVKNGRAPMLGKAYVEDGYTMVCDSYQFIRTSKEVDVPKHDSDIKWLNWRKMYPNTAEMQEVSFPTASELKNYIKLNKKNRMCYVGSTMFFALTDAETNDIICAYNVNYLLNMIEAFSGENYKCYIKNDGKARVDPMVIECEDGSCGLLCPCRVDIDD